jgi:hypothetical protein
VALDVRRNGKNGCACRTVAICPQGRHAGQEPDDAASKANIMAEQMERRSLHTPDDLRPFKDGKGRAEIVTVGGLTLGRGTFEPGWHWSEHVEPKAGTYRLCAGRAHGCEDRRWKRNGIGPGDAFYSPPGHDAWIVRDKPCVLIDVTGFGKYARPTQSAKFTSG